MHSAHDHVGALTADARQLNQFFERRRNLAAMPLHNHPAGAKDIFGLGAEFDVTPKLRSFLNANYILFAETDPIKTALLTDKVDNEVGWDLSLGFQYRPLLTDNIIFSAGFGVLIPGQGYKDIYKTSTDPVPGFDRTDRRGAVDDFLYSGLIAVTFTY